VGGSWGQRQVQPGLPEQPARRARDRVAVVSPLEPLRQGMGGERLVPPDRERPPELRGGAVVGAVARYWLWAAVVGLPAEYRSGCSQERSRRAFRRQIICRRRCLCQPCVVKIGSEEPEKFVITGFTANHQIKNLLFEAEDAVFARQLAEVLVALAVDHHLAQNGTDRNELMNQQSA